MFQTAVLASGSKGNCTVIRTENTKILLDAGLSGKRISQALKSIHLNENKIQALVISHEHNDHIKGAGIICRKFKIPLYITELTYLACKRKLGFLPEGFLFFEQGKSFQIGDLIISPFSASHDVVEGCNFIFRKAGDSERKLAIATDLGFSTKLLLTKLTNATTIILESNHDLKMLLEGSYPSQLKQRVRSRQGHLSNEQATGVISQVIHPGLKNLILAHLSEQNNKPELAKKIMGDFLKEINCKLDLFISLQNKATKIFNI